MTTPQGPGANDLPPEKQTLGWSAPPQDPARAEAAADWGRQTVELLQKRFAAAISEPNEFRGDWCVTVSREQLQAVARFLKDDLGYRQISSCSGVDDYPAEPRFRVVYMLTHMQKKNQFRFQVRLAGESPEVDTVSSVWAGANWLEREVYDFFGIRFLNHPDLRRVLMPEDFEGHPLRKDFPLLGVDVGLKARS